jgi:hypothetical protein
MLRQTATRHVILVPLVLRESAADELWFGKDDLISLRSVRSKSASGEDFASTGSFAKYCKPRDASKSANVISQSCSEVRCKQRVAQIRGWSISQGLPK